MQSYTVQLEVAGPDSNVDSTGYWIVASVLCSTYLQRGERHL